MAILLVITSASVLFLDNTVLPALGELQIPAAIGPGTGGILIHEYSPSSYLPSIDKEMLAFERGEIDIVDSMVPESYIDAWTGPLSASRSISTQGKITLSAYTALDMTQLDINYWKPPTNEPSLRQALGYLVDRQTIVLTFLGGQGTPICSGVSAGQLGFKSCTQLGYPTGFGDYQPVKALQTLYEGGWRDNNRNGVLEIGGTEPAIVFLIDTNDSVRLEIGMNLSGQLGNLPGSYTDSNGRTVRVCPSNCRINVEQRFNLGRVIRDVVLNAPYDDWNLYVGGWTLNPEPDHLFYLYSSDYAPVDCGGGWPVSPVLNYGCYVDGNYDDLARSIVNAWTMEEALAAAGAVQNYAWGYNSQTGRITGTMPTIPLNTHQGSKAGWITDQGPYPISNSDGSRACWTGFVGPNIPLDNTWTMTGLHLDNCRTDSTYSSYRGNQQSILDWGFANTVNELNVVSSFWEWDRAALRFTYESMTMRSPTNSKEITPVLAESYGESSYFNTAFGREAAIAVYNLRQNIKWSDGTPFTGADVKFSIDYVKKNFGWNYALVNQVYHVEVVPRAEGGDSVVVFFDDIGTMLARNVGFLQLIPKHVWCPDYDPAAGRDVGSGVAPRAGCPYPEPRYFPSLDFTKQVGTGPYTPVSCTGPDCMETLLLRSNPYYADGSRYWSMAAGVSLQPDVNRDNRVTQLDRDLLAYVSGIAPGDIRFDVDYRLGDKGTWSVLLGLSFLQPSETISVAMRGPVMDSIDDYIIQRLIFEQDQLGRFVAWPPGRTMTYVWPDVDRNNAVDLGDVISVYLNQFVNPQPVSGVSINDVDYNASIDIDDLITTFVWQFTKPPGVV